MDTAFQRVTKRPVDTSIQGVYQAVANTAFRRVDQGVVDLTFQVQKIKMNRPKRTQADNSGENKRGHQDGEYRNTTDLPEGGKHATVDAGFQRAYKTIIGGGPQQVSIGKRLLTSGLSISVTCGVPHSYGFNSMGLSDWGKSRLSAGFSEERQIFELTRKRRKSLTSGVTKEWQTPLFRGFTS